jgi:dTDP-4-amino-4,6-dideoxygalactose transaminase
MGSMVKEEIRKIPLVDLKRQYLSIKEEVDEVMAKVIEREAFTLGDELESFEESFAKYCGTAFAVGVGSGTEALHLTLKALGIGQGDEVITVPNTFVATVEAILMCGARPVFVDVDERTYNMDISQLEKVLTERTKAIIPVHLYGQPAEMDEIMNFACEHGLKVVEDACQAHGAKYGGKRVGSFGDAGCFSFFPSKNLGAFGDGGMIVTDKRNLAERIKRLRHHGHVDKFTHLEPGFCSRLHNLQAAVLSVKLKYLEDWNRKRRRLASIYTRLLSNFLVKTPLIHEKAEHVFHLYVVRVKERDNLREFLNKSGIQTGIHYPIPVHLQPAYRSLGYRKESFPVAETLAKQIISLPLFPEMREEEVGVVVDAFKEFFHQSVRS